MRKTLRQKNKKSLKKLQKSIDFSKIDAIISLVRCGIV